MNGVWNKKPWFWTERFLLVHPHWMHFSILPQLWIPIPRFIGRILIKQKIKKWNAHTQEQYKRLGWDKFDK